jgi:hypothetical protein
MFAEHAAFDAISFDQRRERIRPKDVPAGLLAPFTAQSEADRIEATFRERVKWWNGVTWFLGVLFDVGGDQRPPP